MRVSRVLCLALAATMAGTARAQEPGAVPVRQGTLIPIPYRTYIAFNPSLVVFDFGSIEMENAVAPGVTLGGVGSYTLVNHNRYTSGDFNIRYYPGEVVLRGLSFGLSGGLLRYSARDTLTGATVAIHAPTIGVLGDYNWLIGPTHRFLVGTGIGGKRVLASTQERQKVRLDRAYVTARFVVGYAF